MVDSSDDDTRHDDLEYNPSLEPKSAKAWINLLEESEKAFEDWNMHCDNIDKRYANLGRLTTMARDREFQMFWANTEVLKPSVYAKPPVPVVVPKFKDRRPVYQAASEMLERCSVVSFDLAKIDELMKLVRDDVVLYSRGVAWVRYESAGKKNDYDYEKVCIDFKGRRDFLHGLARNWREVPWVAGASYLTREEARDRFKPYSGFTYQDAEYKVDRDAEEIGGTDNRERAKFWEIWHRELKRVVWVAQGCEDLLDEDEPHLKLQDFFPCPKPAYGTVQPGSLIPVPDVLQYKDQLDEVNDLTGRLHALSAALQAKGFYPAGGGELAEAIETAIKMSAPGVIMVPISNWAAFGGSKETIIWMPIDMIAATVTQLVTIRKQVIDDIYQITGLADIMRGATDARETLGAQELKTQFGSTRIRDKQQELVRIARDLVVISGEIMTEEFDQVTLIEMSQTQLPTQAMQQQQIQELSQDIAQQQQQWAQAQQDPRFAQKQQTDPQAVQQAEQQIKTAIETGQQALKRIHEKPTLEQVMRFLKDNKSKAFTLDIETDSTVMIDENGEKERRAEFLGALTPMLQQIDTMMSNMPESAEFCGALIKFATAPFRAGRELDGSVDNLLEQMKVKAGQPKGKDAVTLQNETALQIEQMKVDAIKMRDKSDAELKQQEMQMRDRHEKMKVASSEKIKMAEINSRRGDDGGKIQQTQLKLVHDREKHDMDMQKLQADQQRDAQKAALDSRRDAEKANMQQAAMRAKQQADAQRAQDQRSAQQFKLMQPPTPRGPMR
jgi:hypothetical protein